MAPAKLWSPMAALLGLAICHLLVAPADGNLLGRAAAGRPLVGATWARGKDARRSLREVLDKALNGEQNQAREIQLDKLEDQLRPLFAALPKNSRGLLGHASVRYALHRHFVHRHGMYVKGLEPGGEPWNSSSPTAILEDRVPSYVQHLFEEFLEEGFGLPELALIAGALEHFIHEESLERLRMAYELTGHAVEEDLDTEAVDSVMDAFLVLQVLGPNHGFSPKDLATNPDKIAEMFPGWPEMQLYVREVRERLLGGLPGTFGFDAVARVVEEVGKGFGKHQDGQCQAMSKALTAKEELGSGRVKLTDFYQAGWQFKESREYLLKIGAADEGVRGARDTYVIIPNYIASTTNCISSSSIYSVCCMDPCEDILRHLEAKVAAPVAKPQELLRLISAIPSATVPAPRELPLALERRLGDIAAVHGGDVPLHGRLFAQWLHHAYPRECPFPARPGENKPMTADEWLKETGSQVTISEDEMQRLLEEAKERAERVNAKDLVDGDMAQTLPWLPEEELVYRHQKPTFAHEIRIIMRAFALISAAFGMIHSLMRSVTTADAALRTGCATKGCA